MVWIVWFSAGDSAQTYYITSALDLQQQLCAVKRIPYTYIIPTCRSQTQPTIQICSICLLLFFCVHSFVLFVCISCCCFVDVLDSVGTRTSFIINVITLPYLLLMVNLISAWAGNLRADKLSISPIFYYPESSSA